MKIILTSICLSLPIVLYPINTQDLYETIIRGDSFELENLLMRGGKHYINSKTATPCETVKRCMLSIAVKQGKKEIVDVLLRYNPDLELCDDDGATPLHLAAKQGDFTLCQRLVTAGINVDTIDRDSRSPLHCAAKNGWVNVVGYLLQNNACITPKAGVTSALTEAAKQNHLDVCKLLLSYGANPNDQDSKGNSVLYNHVLSIKMSYEGCKILLDSGSNPNTPNQQGESTLHLLLRIPEEHVKFLKKMQPDENPEETYAKIVTLFFDYSPNLMLPDQGNKLPLHYGLTLNNKRTRALFERSAAIMFFRPEYKRYRQHPLSIAASKNDKEEVEKNLEFLKTENVTELLDTATLSALESGGIKKLSDQEYLLNLSIISLLLCKGALTTPASGNIIKHLLAREYTRKI